MTKFQPIYKYQDQIPSHLVQSDEEGEMILKSNYYEELLKTKVKEIKIILTKQPIDLKNIIKCILQREIKRYNSQSYRSVIGGDRFRITPKHDCYYGMDYRTNHKPNGLMWTGQCLSPVVTHEHYKEDDLLQHKSLNQD